MKRPISLVRIVVLLLVVLGALQLIQVWRVRKALRQTQPTEAPVKRAASRYALIAFPEGFVLDRETRLVWHRCPLGTTLGRDAAGPLCKGAAEWLTYKFALATAERFASYGDAWRLPTPDELQTLSTPSRCCHSLDPIAFPVFELPEERFVIAPYDERLPFHSTGIDLERRRATRVDAATGKAVEEPLRLEAFVRLVRAATPEELQGGEATRPLDMAEQARTLTRLRPPAREYSADYLAAREKGIASGRVIGDECQSSYPTGEALRGCLSGIRTNLHTKSIEGARWADEHRPAKSYECRFEDPIVVTGCRDHFRKHLGDVWPDLPETTTTAECELEAEAAFRANINYDIATGWTRALDKKYRAMKGAIQHCEAYDRIHALGQKVLNRPGYEGGPSPY